MGTVEGLARQYVLDPTKSRFVVRAYVAGLLSAFGHNPTIAIRSFSGEATLRPDAPELSSLRFEIDAASLAVTGEVNDKDRAEMERAMRGEVLETARYAAIRFESSAVQATKITEAMYAMKIAGNLALHGVTRDLEIPCTVTAGDESFRAYGDFSIRQSDYGIHPVTVAGGTLKLKDELKFTFDIVGRRKAESGV
jgi:polyisoprenoid-binding protein YceI